ncbi:hypothetical protein AAG747_16890 [Rapidithrix thailandica]|uniref:Glycosyltransferase n=1 Tax=Rapidithrix thailandica TaxID=413964 RepID=A0AAW9SE34_9BACT
MSMQKLLIISYFFPPCNLTAAQRTFSWANYLKEFGYNPIVLTRRWDHPVKSLKDTCIPTLPEEEYQQHQAYEVHYVPYLGNLRDRIYTKYGEQKYSSFRRILSSVEIFFQNYANTFIPFNNIYQKAREILKKDPSIRKVAISGNPFIQFKFGYLLQKEFGVKWIADYRDAWTTSEINQMSKGKWYGWVEKHDRPFEKKWVGSASYITSVSSPLAEGIHAITSRPFEILYNGFEATDFSIDKKELKPYDRFTITYVGTLYEGQNIGIFCDAYKEFIRQHPNVKIFLKFPGLAFDKVQSDRVKGLLKGFEKYFECTERIPRDEVIETELRSHVLLHVAWKGFKGIVASKIYEYIGSSAPILVAPGDEGEIDRIIDQSGCGEVAYTKDEIINYLEKMYKLFERGEFTKNDVNSKNIQQFSRKNQVAKLAALLDTL